MSKNRNGKAAVMKALVSWKQVGLPFCLSALLPFSVFASIVLASLLITGCTQQVPESSSPSTSPSSLTVSNLSESGSSMDKDKQFGPLQAVEYSNSGNMLGNMYWIETDYDEDGSLILREADSPQHDQRATIREFRAPEDLLDQISAIADEYGMKEWDDLPMSEFFPLDASTPTIRLVYENNDPKEHFPIRISFTAYEEFPEGGEDGFDAVRNLLMDSLTEDNLICEYLEPMRN